MISTSIFVFGEDLQVRISPNPVLENQSSQITIVIPGSESIRQVEFPEIEGITWQKNVTGSQTSIINGTVTRSQSYGFIVSKIGKITLPRIKITTDKGVHYTQPASFTVGKASSGIFAEDGSEIPLSLAVFLHVQPMNAERQTFFVGEEIPVYVCIISNPGVQVSLTAFPELVSGSTFSARQRGNGAVQEVNYDGKKMNAIIFPVDLQSTKAGTFDADFSATANCSTGGNRAVMNDPFEDPFFSNAGGFFSRRSRGSPPIALPLKGQLKNVQIKNRPPVPAGVIDLGIITTRPIKWEFSTATPKQGDPVYLDLQISGNPSGFKSPEINIDGFRSYQPEMTEVPASATAEALTKVRVMLIPLNAGEQKISLKFATLDPASGTFKIANVEKVLNVSENKNILKGSVPAIAPAISGDMTAKAENRGEEILSSNILYIKHLTAEGLQNQATPQNLKQMLIMFFSAIAAWIVFCGSIVLWIFYRKKHANSPEAKRRSRANSKKGDLLKKLKTANEENFDEIVRTEVTDYIADARGLPSFDDAKNSMKNKELQEVISAAESAGYNPNARCGNVEKFRKIVVKAIKSSSFILIAGFVFIAMPEKAFAAEKIDVPALILSAENSYATGKFTEACADYGKLAEANPLSPELWFNLGNANYQKKDYASALLCYERAYRLAISTGSGKTSFILSNLNAAEIQLGLPVRNEVKTPADFFLVIRDGLSQRLWLCAGFFIFAVMMLVVIFIGIGKNRRGYLIGGIVLGIFALSLSLFNSIWMERDLFNKQDAIVLAKNASIWNLPIENSAKKIGSVPEGQFVKIIESRERWFLVRTSGNTEGWVTKSDIAKIWGDFSVPVKLSK